MPRDPGAELMCRYARWQAAALTHGADHAEDIAQDAIMHVLERFPDKPRDEQRAILRRQVEFEYMGDRRRRAREASTVVSYVDAAPDREDDGITQSDALDRLAAEHVCSAEEEAMKRELAAAVHEAVSYGLLTCRQYEAFRMFYADGHSIKEVAEAMGVSVGTVKTTCHDAMKKVRAALVDLARLYGIQLVEGTRLGKNSR